MYIVKSNLGYYNNSIGWVDNKENSSKYQSKDQKLLENLKYFFLDIREIIYEQY